MVNKCKTGFGRIKGKCVTEKSIRKIMNNKSKKYKQIRILRDSEVGTVKKFREALTKHTFTDLDSRGTNSFLNHIRKKEKLAVKRFRNHDNRLNKLDREIDNLTTELVRSKK